MSPAQIKALRDARGWSQSALASRLGVSTSAVSSYEQGARSPGPSALIILRDLAEHAAYDPAYPDGYRVVPQPPNVGPVQPHGAMQNILNWLDANADTRTDERSGAEASSTAPSGELERAAQRLLEALRREVRERRDGDVPAHCVSTEVYMAAVNLDRVLHPLRAVETDLHRP